MSAPEKETYPAEFNKIVKTPEDIDPPTGDGLACDWGNAEACRDDNILRAEFAGVGVRAYATVTASLTEPIDTAIADMLGDLMHLCDALGLEFDALADSARNHYEHELRGEF